MNYKKIYKDLIDRAIIRVPDEFTETHHITPKCIGGTNDRSNLVELTPEEHFLAHQLLIKIYPNEPKLVLAARYMCHGSNNRRINNKMFGWLRRKHAEAMSKINTGRYVSPELAKKRGDSQKGRISPMKGKKHRADSKQKTSESLTGIKRPPRTATHIENHANSIRGKSRAQEVKDKISNSTKGKSYEERYGSEEAVFRKEKLKKSWELRKLNKISQDILQP